LGLVEVEVVVVVVQAAGPPDPSADVQVQGGDQDRADHKVSSSTPKATAKPISVMNTSGRVPRAAKVPASTIPAEVITPPVAAGLQSYGGAVAEVGDDETAFSHRDALVEFVAVANWTDPAEDQPGMSAARRYAGAVEPFASGVYVNALGDEGEEGVQRAYGPDKLARFAALKDRYDPENVFHLNHNIRPRKEQPR
jgi:Berberine and berberine like